MATRPAKVTQAEVTRALKGALDAGFQVGRVDVDARRGVVSIFPAGVDAAPAVTQMEGRNSCDDAFGLP